ncbi:hypothetical protein DMUE_5634 [Dictyocoela muelleri]|nr:hypothetical protein DMUE_5634 [Dictyocoela muelleri]
MLITYIQFMTTYDNEFTKKYNLYKGMDVLNRNKHDIRVNYFNVENKILYGAMIDDKEYHMALTSSLKFVEKLIKYTDEYNKKSSKLKFNFDMIEFYKENDQFRDFLDELEIFIEKIENKSYVEYVFFIFCEKKVTVLFKLANNECEIMNYQVSTDIKEFEFKFINLLNEN